MQLIEIQESVLPEDEWLIGISDLGYFEGVGYSMPITNGDANENSLGNLYAFIPGLFYCSSQQTSVDAVLIEVTHKSLSGVMLPSFRPEDVRTFDVRGGITLDEVGEIKPFEITAETLGSFGIESFMKESGISHESLDYKQEIQIASQLAQKIPLGDLKKAYISSSFLQTRLTKLLDDIEFYGLKPRMRIYVRNKNHPYGTVVDAKYEGLSEDGVSNHELNLKILDDIEMEKELTNLLFPKMVDLGIEIKIERAILDMLHYIGHALEGSATHQEVLRKLFEGDTR